MRRRQFSYFNEFEKISARWSFHIWRVKKELKCDSKGGSFFIYFEWVRKRDKTKTQRIKKNDDCNHRKEPVTAQRQPQITDIEENNKILEKMYWKTYKYTKSKNNFTISLGVNWSVHFTLFSLIIQASSVGDLGHYFMNHLL